jgi:hypothetical protein
LSWLFAPALAVFPLQGFSLADVQALRFVQEPSPAGGARWVHLYAATLLLLVVLPRLVLALISALACAPHRAQLPARPATALLSPAGRPDRRRAGRAARDPVQLYCRRSAPPRLVERRRHGRSATRRN